MSGATPAAAQKKVRRRGWFSIDNEIDWDPLVENLNRHRHELEVAHSDFSRMAQSASFELSITDLITEKAVDHLSRRSTVYYNSAWALLLATGVSIGAAIWWFEAHTIANFVDGMGTLGGFTNTQVTIMFLTRAVTIGAMFAAAPAILGGLSFSYFHEATAAYHQRHIIRFGRLWVDLQLSGEDSRKPTLQEFRQAFGLENQYDTAFRRLRMPKNISGETADVVKALAKALKESSGKARSGYD